MGNNIEKLIDSRILINESIEEFIKSEFPYEEKILSLKFGNIYDESVIVFLYTGSGRGRYLDTININISFFNSLTDLIKNMYNL